MTPCADVLLDEVVLNFFSSKTPRFGRGFSLNSLRFRGFGLAVWLESQQLLNLFEGIFLHGQSIMLHRRQESRHLQIHVFFNEASSLCNRNSLAL